MFKFTLTLTLVILVVSAHLAILKFDKLKRPEDDKSNIGKIIIYLALFYLSTTLALPFIIALEVSAYSYIYDFDNAQYRIKVVMISVAAISFLTIPMKLLLNRLKTYGSVRLRIITWMCGPISIITLAFILFAYSILFAESI